MNQDPFFIIGAPRSGTTMLRLALARHSQVVVPPETHFFTLAIRSRRGQLRQWKWIERDLQIELAPPAHRIRPGAEAGEHFWRIMEAYRQRLGKTGITHYGEKTPDHQRRVAGILKTFPKARFILIYRDGRDVALSLSKAPFMPPDLDLNFQVWLHFYRIQRRLLERQPQRMLCVRYEDLVRNPAQELSVVLDFLDLANEPRVAKGDGGKEGVPEHSLPYHWRALQPITSQRIGNWQRELSGPQISRLERWGGWALRELGYECVTDGRGFLPPWSLPWVYGRLAAAVATRTLQRKTDELLGTSFYLPNRMATNPDASAGSVQSLAHVPPSVPAR